MKSIDKMDADYPWACGANKTVLIEHEWQRTEVRGELQSLTRMIRNARYRKRPAEEIAQLETSRDELKARLSTAAPILGRYTKRGKVVSDAAVDMAAASRSQEDARIKHAQAFARAHRAISDMQKAADQMKRACTTALAAGTSVTGAAREAMAGEVDEPLSGDASLGLDVVEEVVEQRADAPPGDGRPRCGVMTRGGQPCKRLVKVVGGRCPIHAGEPATRLCTISLRQAEGADAENEEANARAVVVEDGPPQAEIAEAPQVAADAQEEEEEEGPAAWKIVLEGSVKKVGSGAQGDVVVFSYKGYEVVRKVHSGLGTEVNALERLQRHPNIVRLFYSCPQYIYMEAAQHDLFDALYVHGLPVADVTFCDLAKGLEHIHNHHMAHCDLKSKNVLLVEGRAKLCDFGSVRAVVDGKLQGAPPCGTLQWCAPEVLGGGADQTVMCDMWALGCVYLEMLCRATPWDLQQIVEGEKQEAAPSAAWVRQQLQNGKRPFPEPILAVVPDVVKRCLAPKAAERPAPRELEEHFAQAAVGRLAADSQDAAWLATICKLPFPEPILARVPDMVKRGLAADSRDDAWLAVIKNNLTKPTADAPSMAAVAEDSDATGCPPDVTRCSYVTQCSYVTHCSLVTPCSDAE